MDESLVIVEDGEEAPVEVNGIRPWKLLIVDDDPRVHDITRYALEDFRFEGRAPAFLDAMSGEEAVRVLRENPDIAVVLLDVVMETDDAGLRVVRAVREDLENRLVRVILRTGQPGQAPERDVVVNYDINDYKAKAELTATRLFTTVLAALRAHSQLLAAEMSRRGLERILEASTSLYERRSVSRFVEGVVMQIRSLVSDSEGAILCMLAGPRFEGDIDDVRVVAGAAPFTFTPGETIRATLPDPVCSEIADALSAETSVFGEDHCVVFFRSSESAAGVIYLCGHRRLGELDRKLLEVFCSKVAIGFDNARLFERIVFEKSHDGVTGLMNRAAFAERIDVRKPETGPSVTAVVTIDYDRFRDVNDTLGFAAGDRLLTLLAERIEGMLETHDFAARLGADQFTIAWHGTDDDLDPWLRRLSVKLAEPLIIDGREVIPSVSIGVKRVGPIAGRAEDHIAEADRAMRRAKGIGGGVTAIAPDRRVESGRLALVTELTRAVRDDGFEVFFQPIVRSVDRGVAGFEALVRWRHPERGLLSPIDFIEVAEETGLIVPIGGRVLEAAVDQFARWSEGVPGADELTVCVNVSARQFLRGDLVGDVARALERTGFEPSRLKLEVTESLIISDPDRALEILRRLRAMGTRLSLDDFGTGYSSLSYLDRFPFDTLKIDRSFVQAMLTRRETMAIVEATIGLSRALNLGVVGEGVETEAEAEALASMGVRWCQGYLFGRPMPADQVVAYLGERLATVV